MTHPILQRLDIADVILQIVRAKVCRNLWRKKVEQDGPSEHLLPCFGENFPIIPNKYGMNAICVLTTVINHQ
jgi:hypothetical protein